MSSTRTRIISFLLFLVMLSLHSAVSFAEKIWSLDGSELNFKSFHFTIPHVFSVFYEEQSSDKTVAFYPEPKDSYATLQFETFDSTYEKEYITSPIALKSIEESLLDYFSNFNTVSSETQESQTTVALNYHFSMVSGIGESNIYTAMLYDIDSKDVCIITISVDAEDEGYYNYEKVFQDLVDSVLNDSKSVSWICPNCQNNATGNFCSNCGTSRPGESNQTSQDPKSESTDTSISQYKALMDTASEMAKIIKYNTPVPTPGSMEEVNIYGNNFQVSSELKYYFDVVFALCAEYDKAVKNKDQFMIAKIIEAVDKTANFVNEIDRGKMPANDLLYVMSVFTQLSTLQAE